MFARVVCLPCSLPPCFFVVFFHPISFLRPFLFLSLLVVTQIRGHIAGSSPPLPTTVRALHFYREKISALSALLDSSRIGRGAAPHLQCRG